MVLGNPVRSGLFYCLSLMALAGCAGSPWDSSDNDLLSAGFDDPNRQPYSQLSQAFPQRSAAVAQASPTASYPQPAAVQPENSFLASMRSASGAITNALTLESPVDPPADPTSLSTSTPDVGGELHYRAARVHESQNNVGGAMSYYQQALQIDPQNTRYLVGYARMLDRQGYFAEAEQFYQQATQAAPQQASLRNDLGLLYARQSMLDQAVAELQQAVQLAPRDQRYRNNLAIVLIDAGRTQEAFAHLAAGHGEAVAHYNLAYLLFRREQKAAALEHVEQALVLNPSLLVARQLHTRLTRSPAIPSAQPAAGYQISAASVAPDQMSRGWTPNSERSALQPLPPF